MKTFADRIAASAPRAADLKNRRWIYIPYDRFTDRTGPLAEQPAAAYRHRHRRVHREGAAPPLPQEKARRPHQQHAPLRAGAGGPRRLRALPLLPASHGQALPQLQRERKLPALTVMTPAERELRLDLAAAVARRPQRSTFVEDTTWALRGRGLHRRLRLRIQAPARATSWIASTAACARRPAS